MDIINAPLQWKKKLLFKKKQQDLISSNWAPITFKTQSLPMGDAKVLNKNLEGIEAKNDIPTYHTWIV